MKIIYAIQDYWDYYRMCLAAWIYPRTYENSVKYVQLRNSVYNVMSTFDKSVPEVVTVLNWIEGKDWDQSNETVPDEVKMKMYPTYYKYRSLVHFRDIVTNDYRRKLK